MTEFIYGFIGAIIALILFCGGFAAAMYCTRHFAKHVPTEAPVSTPQPDAFSPTEQEQMAEARRRMEEEQKAFTDMLHFSVNNVYGEPTLEDLERKSKG